MYVQVDDFLANEAKGTKIIGAKSLEDMVAKLKKPRKVMLLVKGIIYIYFITIAVIITAINKNENVVVVWSYFCINILTIDL